jgi:serine/threonine protein kinase
MADPPAPNAADSNQIAQASVAPGGKLERFLLLEKLGAGGMGVVFKARDSESGAIVALKTLQKLRPGTLMRFKNEFRAIQDKKELRHHPNLVTLYEHLYDKDCDTWFFTMEHIPGRNLASFISTEIGVVATRSTE